MTAEFEEILELFVESSTSSSLENTKHEELLDMVASFADNDSKTETADLENECHEFDEEEELDMDLKDILAEFADDEEFANDEEFAELEAEMMVDDNEVMSDKKNNDSGFTGGSVEHPICTDDFTFLPGCCGKITSCGSCDATKAQIKRTSNADLAANALRLNMVSSFSSFRADLVSSITNFCIVYVAQ